CHHGWPSESTHVWRAFEMPCPAGAALVWAIEEDVSRDENSMMIGRKIRNPLSMNNSSEREYCHFISCVISLLRKAKRYFSVRVSAGRIRRKPDSKRIFTILGFD